MALTPGDHVLLKTDDMYWRHAVILGSADDIYHQVLTPARFIRHMDFSDVQIHYILPWDGETLPKGLKAVNCIRDVDAPKGAFSDREIARAISQVAGKAKDGDALVSTPPRTRIRGKRGVSDEAPVLDDRTPEKKASFAKVTALDGEDAARDIEPRPVGRTGDIADGEGWSISCGLGAATVGSPVSLKGVEHTLLGDMALFYKVGSACVAFWSKAENVASQLRGLQARCSGHHASRLEGREDIFHDPSETPPAGKSAEKEDAAADAAEPDLRILACHYERDGRRFRRLQDAELEHDEEGGLR